MQRRWTRSRPLTQCDNQSITTGTCIQESSLLHSAMEGLSWVKKNDVLEVMSYREPPATTVPVFNTLCMLFDRPQTSVARHYICVPSSHLSFCLSWEECKQLLLSPNFFESLKFFDKDNIPRHKLRQLKSMLQSPEWRVDSLQHASRYTAMTSNDIPNA